jgi:hypothetical protein
LPDIRVMNKPAKSTSTHKVSRSATSGQFIGRASDGTAIAKPVVKPRSFSVEKLQRVIRDVQRQELKAG